MSTCSSRQLSTAARQTTLRWGTNYYRLIVAFTLYSLNTRPARRSFRGRTSEDGFGRLAPADAATVHHVSQTLVGEKSAAVVPL